MSNTVTQGVVRLADWGVIRAEGADGASFLHGQLTQDVLHLGADRAALAGYCSAKGRLLASFVMWRESNDSVLLACSADVLAITLKRLSMFVLRAKCKLSDASGDVALYGQVGADAPAAWQRHDDLIGLPPADGLARALRVSPAPSLPSLDATAWQWLEVRSGVARIVAATADRFVPQMVNLELVGGVNFQKGCYPGQEVVARSQYRGTLKRRAFVFDADAPAAPGDEIFHSADPGQPAGMVANAATLGARHGVLAEVKLAAIDGGTLHLRTPDGPLLRRAAMPYDVPLEAAA